MTLTATLVKEWATYEGRTDQRTQRLDVESLRRFAVASGLTADVETVMPVLAHWAWFLPTVEDAAIGVDGHPKRGGFMPPITLPRRMFASATMYFDTALDLDTTALLETVISRVTHKSGRSGELIFVDVDRSISQQGTMRVRERQTIVYRDAGESTPMPIPVRLDNDETAWTPDSVNLFRFSAATFNSHRIHYDLPYAILQEGYPSLVVHGPLIAVRLAAYAAARRDTPISRFEFKGLAPAFVGQPLRFGIGADAGEFDVVRCDKVKAMSAKVLYR